MTTTAAERADALQPHLDQARRQVAGLEAAVRDAEQRAHNAYVAADVATADGAHAEAAGLRRELDAAQARLQTFEQAAHVVSEQRHREELEAQYARVNGAHADALAVAQREAAEVRPALAAAKLALRRAQQAEDLSRKLEIQRYELEVGLGMRQRGIFHPNTNAVQAMVEYSPYLRELLANPEL